MAEISTESPIRKCTAMRAFLLIPVAVSLMAVLALPGCGSETTATEAVTPGETHQVEPTARTSPTSSSVPASSQVTAPTASSPMTPSAPSNEALRGLVLIPGGEFEMGDHHGLGSQDPEHATDEVPVHSVNVDSFYMGSTEATNLQYCDYLNSALEQGLVEVKGGVVYPSGGSEILFETHESDPYSRIGWDGSTFAVLDNKGDHPVTSVRWQGAAAYTNWISSQYGYEGCYDFFTWECDFSKEGFRLPTEAEWEYAARGGQYDQYYVYPWGDDADNTKANWPDSGDPYETGSHPWTTPVGFYKGQLHRKADFGWPGSQESYQTSDGSNSYGLYDMAGNVWEWVDDWYSRDYYSSSSYDNPHDPDQDTPMPDGRTYHVLRGGNWYNGLSGHSRVANRNSGYYRGPDDPNHAWYHVGFRVVLDFQGGKLAESVPASGTEPTSPQASTPTRPSVPDQRPARQQGEDQRQRVSGPDTGQGVSQEVGLLRNDPRSFNGYTLFAPKHFTVTYLIDNDGSVVNTWNSDYEPGQSVYLLENGHLLHTNFTKNNSFIGGGEGGGIEEYDWDGNLVWEFWYSSDQYLTHHDIEPLPNGNVLALVVEKKTYEECVAAGFDLEMLRDGELFPDSVIEIEKTGPKSGRVVWEWHVWDHLIQDHDPSKADYGVVAEHPELIDVHGAGGRIPRFWNHMNSIDYNEELDQILLSVRGFSEIWVIDHSTTVEEVAGHTGGRSGKGGDLLFRWGNPQAYRAGNASDQRLFDQHDAQWIPSGYPGEGNILVFNNGLGRGYSSVDEIVPTVESDGNYRLTSGPAYGPEEPIWTFKAENPDDLYSEAISGAQRLPNGNTLICDGVHGVFFEVTPGGETVWQYVNPVIGTGPVSRGDTIPLDDRGHQMNAVFKIERYAPDYPGLVDRELAPGGSIETSARLEQGTGPDEASLQGGVGPQRQPPQESAPDGKEVRQ